MDYQNSSWQGGAPAQPGSWGPQGNQGAAMPPYGGQQQQPTEFEFIRSQAELNQQLVAALTSRQASGPQPSVLAALEDSQNSAAAESGTKELQSVLKYKINSGKPPSFANRDSEDVERFWRDWRRFLSNNYSGAGVSHRNQLELLRTYLEGDVRTDFLNIVDALEPLEEED